MGNTLSISNWFTVGLIMVWMTLPYGCAAAHQSKMNHPPTFLPITQGIQTQHATQTPWLEHVETSPDLNSYTAFRIYPDGTYYRILSLSTNKPAWEYLTHLSEEGISKLERQLTSWCANPPSSQNLSSGLTWRIHQTDCQVTWIVPWGDKIDPDATSRQILDLIVSHLIPR